MDELDVPMQLSASASEPLSMKIDRSPARRQLGDEARRFAEDNIAPVAKEYDANETFPSELVTKAAKLGFAGWQISSEYGGPGHSLGDAVPLFEEMFAVDPGIGWAILGAGFGSEPIQEYGTETMKQRYLPPIANGDAIIAVAISEPGVGSDASAIETEARLEDDEWVIDGEKRWVTNGSVSDYIVVLCQTDPESEGRYNGFSQIVVEADDPGVEQQPITGKSVVRAGDMANVRFDGTRVPRNRLVGDRGMGFLQQMKFFNLSRTTIAAQAVGIARGAADRTLEYAKGHEQFGRPIAEFQSLQHEFARMYTHIEAIRLLTYRAASAVDNEEDDAVKLASMAKEFAPRIAAEVTDEAVQIHGANGFAQEHEVVRLHRDAKITQVYEGPSKLQRTIIANELM